MTELLLANPLMNPWDENTNWDYDQSKCIKAQNPHKDDEHKVSVGLRALIKGLLGFYKMKPINVRF